MSAITTSELPTPSQRQWLSFGLVVAGILIAFTTLFFEFLERQFRFAIEAQADWGHTLIIPLLAGYLVYYKWDKLSQIPFRTTWIGLIPVLVGALFYTFCSLSHQYHHHNYMGAGVCLTIFGIVLLFAGWRAMLYLWFPLLFLFVFGQTISERLMNIVTFPLQDLTARGAYFGFNYLLGRDCELSGNTIYVLGKDGVARPLNIAEACSGMRMLMAFLALGVLIAFTGLKYFWQQTVLVIMAVPTSIFVNILRVMTLGLLGLKDMEFAAGKFHEFVGMVWLVPALLMYLGIVWILRNVVVEAVPAKSKMQASPSTRRPKASGGRHAV